MKTSELIGPALDWAVAKCLTLTGNASGFDVQENVPLVLDGHWDYAQFSRNWEQAGPIITRERINLQFCRDLRNPHGLYIHACSDTNVNHGYWRGDHEHPLVAAMRCFVASKLGDEIDVPKELT